MKEIIRRDIVNKLGTMHLNKSSTFLRVLQYTRLILENNSYEHLEKEVSAVHQSLLEQTSREEKVSKENILIRETLTEILQD